MTTTSPLDEVKELHFCESCGQMTNHLDGLCMKHKKPGYNPAEHFTVKGWEELGKLFAKGDSE